MSRVMMGSKTCLGRWFWRRWVTGALEVRGVSKNKIKQRKICCAGEGRILKIPRTQRPSHAAFFEIVHQLDETGLGLLLQHRLPLDGLYFGDGLGALCLGWQASDVVEDVDRSVDS